MKKIKFLFYAFILLCVSLVGCNDDILKQLPATGWDKGIIVFHPIRLSTDNYSYNAVEDGGILSPNTVFFNFWNVFDWAGITRNQSSITAKTTYPHPNMQPRSMDPIYSTSKLEGPDRLRVPFYYDGKENYLQGQVLEIEIRSGTYKRAEDDKTSYFVWTWRGRDRDFNVNQIMHDGTTAMFEAGEFKTTAARVIINNGSSGGSSNNRCPICPAGQMYAQDDIEMVLYDPYVENKYGQEVGTLNVYATAETIQSIYSGGSRSINN